MFSLSVVESYDVSVKRRALSGTTFAKQHRWVCVQVLLHQSRLYTNDWEDDYKYRCPDCDKNLPKVGGLLQHTETLAYAAG